VPWAAKIGIQLFLKADLPLLFALHVWPLINTSPASLIFRSMEFGMATFVVMRLLLLILILVPVVISAQVFVDQSEEQGFENSYGECFLAGGVSFTDFDMDGEEDILTSSCSGEPIYVFRGTPNGFVPYSIQAALADTGRSKAVYAVDLDNDGDREIFITNFQSRNTLLWNNAGEYVNVSDQAGISSSEKSSFSASFGDYNLDGYLDIYVVNRTVASNPQDNVLYRNNGDGTFENVTQLAGVGNIDGAGLAVSFFEYNNDGWPDLYIANDKFTGNVLFVNQADGTFQDVSSDSGTDLDMDGMSVTLADYNDDGYLDIYVSNTVVDGNRFLVSNGDLTYDEVAEELDVVTNKFCWGSQFVDFDGDMDEDLFVPSFAPDFDNMNTFYLRDQDQLIDWSDDLLEADFSESMGSAKADFDHDGDYDLAVLNTDIEGSYLLENQSDPFNYVKFCLEGTTSNYEGIGSWIEVHAGGVIQRRYTTLGSNFAGQDSRYHIFGLGESDSIDLIRITWPSGIVQEILDQGINETTCFQEPFPTDIQEGQNEMRLWPNPAQDYLLLEGFNGNYSIRDYSGRIVQRGQVESRRIEISALSDGVYVLVTGQFAQRFLKQGK
jgi:hypothetical protein